MDLPACSPFSNKIRVSHNQNGTTKTSFKLVCSSMASLVLTDNSQLTSDSQHLGSVEVVLYSSGAVQTRRETIPKRDREDGGPDSDLTLVWFTSGYTDPFIAYRIQLTSTAGIPIRKEAPAGSEYMDEAEGERDRGQIPVVYLAASRDSPLGKETRCFLSADHHSLTG
uniref:(California timema) hypothetical protein n=1 Tax=Timema californicum TaxID=61474 RepID=A0A7R9J588_TIMCA|nr:unnamed protein product [Timema californicum]